MLSDILLNSLTEVFGMEQSDAYFPSSGETAHDEVMFLETESFLEQDMDAELRAEIEAEVDEELKTEADSVELAAFLEAEAEAYHRANPKAETEVTSTESLAEVDAEESESESESESEADPAAPAAAASHAAPPVPAGAAPTPIPAPAVNATAGVNATAAAANGTAAANATAAAPIPVDEEDAAMIQNALVHDGRTGAIKPILPDRKNAAASAAELEASAKRAAEVQANWNRRAEDEQRTQEATNNLALKAMGLLPPVEKHVVAATGAMVPDTDAVLAGTDMQGADASAGCNQTVAKAPTA